jgi:transcriptional regulator with PAS, ATPase and Fis domain
LPSSAQEKLAARLSAAGSPPDEELALDWPGVGQEPRRFVCSTVSHEGHAVGAVLRLLPAAGPRAHRGAARARAPSARYGFDDILGRSERLAAALDLARMAAWNDMPLVLHGESGTGKELFAHAIHGHGPRADGRFVAVNCGAIPAPLVEAELFGYEAGTFTGAQRDGRAGRLEEAHGGTLFLDEVSELAPQAQTALLRALQECEVVRLGGSSSRPVDVRVITATHRRLSDEVASGRFRQDLFFRLDVLSIEIPPLRDRGADVGLLAGTFLAEAAARVNRPGLELSGAALEALVRHPWPGNVRELRNVMMRAAATAVGSVVQPQDLQLLEGRSPATVVSATTRTEEPPSSSCGAPASGEASDPEREELVAALDRSEWNIARTATALGVSRQTLYRRLRKFGITH